VVLCDVVILAAAGIAASLPVMLALSEPIESSLFGVKPNDPAALSAAVAILLTAALLAGFMPARRASRIEPTVAIRQE
jgi:ABC-type antimicrobial peptide transport system permease subunit